MLEPSVRSAVLTYWSPGQAIVEKSIEIASEQFDRDPARSSFEMVITMGYGDTSLPRNITRSVRL